MRREVSFAVVFLAIGRWLGGPYQPTEAEIQAARERLREAEAAAQRATEQQQEFLRAQAEAKRSAQQAEYLRFVELTEDADRKAAAAGNAEDTVNQLLRIDAENKATTAANAGDAVDQLRAKFMTAKLTIPRHPWRKIDGVALYVKSPAAGFYECRGTVLQTIERGVFVTGSCGTHVGDYFLDNFPPPEVADGQKLDSLQMFAVNSGFKTLTTKLGAKQIDLGAERKVVRMDYGLPCERPKNAAAIEAEALKLTASEEAAIYRAQQDAAVKQDKADRAAQAAKKLQPSEEAAIVRAQQDAATKQIEATGAAKKLQDYLRAMEEEKQRAIAAKNAPKEKALKWHQEQAAKGDAFGLFRMGERYRDGDGVPKDLNKAREYLTKAAAAGSPTAADALSKLNQVSTNVPAIK